MDRSSRLITSSHFFSIRVFRLTIKIREYYFLYQKNRNSYVFFGCSDAGGSIELALDQTYLVLDLILEAVSEIWKLRQN